MAKISKETTYALTSVHHTANNLPTLSVIVPAYNEQEILFKSYLELKEELQKTKESYEILFINDGSTDETQNILLRIASNDPTVRVIKLARNFGHESATTAGMHYCLGKAAVVIDADMQDPPSVIFDMLEKWKQGFEVVYGVREKREGESLFKKITAYGFYFLIGKIADVKVPKNTGDYRLMDRKVIDVYKSLKEEPRFFRGLISWIGFRQVGVTFVRRPRAGGVSKYRYSKLFRLAFDTITSFSTLPSLVISFVAFSFAIIGMVGTGITVCLWALQFVQVNTLIWCFLGLMNLVNLQFCALAVLGEYIVRSHYHTQNRPPFIVETITELKDER